MPLVLSPSFDHSANAISHQSKGLIYCVHSSICAGIQWKGLIADTPLHSTPLNSAVLQLWKGQALNVQISLLKRDPSIRGLDHAPYVIMLNKVGHIDGDSFGPARSRISATNNLTKQKLLGIKDNLILVQPSVVNPGNFITIHLLDDDGPEVIMPALLVSALCKRKRKRWKSGFKYLEF